jgi:DNA-binding PucR family transcriptional regulator
VLRDDAPALSAELAALDVVALADPVATSRVLRIAADTFRDYSVVATREAELREELARLPDVVATVPAFEDDVHDVVGLARIGDSLFAD